MCVVRALKLMAFLPRYLQCNAMRRPGIQGMPGVDPLAASAAVAGELESIAIGGTRGDDGEGGRLSPGEATFKAGIFGGKGMPAIAAIDRMAPFVHDGVMPGKSRSASSLPADAPKGFFPMGQGGGMSGISAIRGTFDESRRRQLPFHSSADHVMHRSKHKPGYGLLALRSRCSFIMPLLYALLQGRTVVVMAHPDNEMKVRDIITVLRLFVPGHSTREQVIPWRAAQPLKLTDLARIKLIGLSKKIPHGIPKSVQVTVSMLDYDKEVLISPTYVT